MTKPIKILVTGASGQIGTELVAALRKKYGNTQVVATDIHDRSLIKGDGPCYSLNVLNKEALEWIFETLQITQVYHLAAALSANAEHNPASSWDLNMTGLLNVLDTARKFNIEKVFWPSSIAVFGPKSSKAACAQSAVTDPMTVYGISKVAGEQWCKYYNYKYGMDIRSLRYPGLISHSAPAGGGTTDYAVDIFHKAIITKAYTVYLRCNTPLPMLYMEDAIRGTIELMEAPKEKITVNTSYNLGGIDFTPLELANEIKKHIPKFEMSCEVDEIRQQIADSWPYSIDDRHARADWGWQPRYDLKDMVSDMLKHLNQKYTGEPVG